MYLNFKKNAATSSGAIRLENVIELAPCNASMYLLCSRAAYYQTFAVAHDHLITDHVVGRLVRSARAGSKHLPILAMCGPESLQTR